MLQNLLFIHELELTKAGSEQNEFTRNKSKHVFIKVTY